MEKKEILCDSCSSSCKVIHDEDEYYVVKFCPFCGTELIPEDVEDIEEDIIIRDEDDGFYLDEDDGGEHF